MALIRYSNPFQELEEMQTRLNQFFNDAFEPINSTQADMRTPTADVYLDEDNEEMIVEAHLPGFRSDEVEINVDNGVLNIRAEHTRPNESDRKRKYILRESSTSFYRRIGLPKHVDSSHIQANFEDGIIEITIPFKDLPKPQTVKIEPGRKKKNQN